MKGRKRASGSHAGKNVLITGAAKHIGREIALAMAAAGWNVAFTYLSSRREAEALVRKIRSHRVEGHALRCDVRNERSVQKAVTQVTSELGKIDLLVNNAGLYETMEWDRLSIEQWDEMFNINVRGPFLVSRACALHLKEAKGRIINLGSLGGIRPWGTHAHYCQSKAALHMQTLLLAKALAPEVAVNCVAPGMIDLQEKPPSEFLRKIADKTPMRRNGTSADVAAAVMFFATAPSFITGQILLVDGGLNLV
jgi:NAD(P)-dependent dehydrogenase (short-subunit alcohol dehydrogenase family)